MNTKDKAIFVSAILVGLGAYFIYKNMKNKSANTEAVVTDEIVATTLDTTKVLSKGSTGDEVKSLQKALRGGLKVDGNFGALTEKRLKAVTGQKSISLRDYNIFITSTKK